MNERPGPGQDPEIEAPGSPSDRPIPRRLLRPLQEFLDTSTASGVFLLGAVVVALAWVNSPWDGAYRALFSTRFSVGAGDHAVAGDLRFWIDEGLMAIFFLVAGLEIKRELTKGELRHHRAALLPVVAAAGGMAVPALLYLAIVAGGPGGRGWGIPMATDVAFSLGVLALAAARTPSGLRPLLLALAIVDDIGSVVVVAAFSAGTISAAWLAVAVVVASLLVVFPRIHLRAWIVSVALGGALWYAMFRAGLHPALAGVVVGLLTPSEALTRVEHRLLPWSSFLVLPAFALANAGVELSASSLAAAAGSSVAWAILVARVGGKVLGIWGVAAVASRFRLVDLPTGVRSTHLLGMAAAAGAGFTVSLFVAQVVFGPDSPLLPHVKISLLAASVVAGVLGWTILRLPSASTGGAELPRDAEGTAPGAPSGH
jgi:NhaA family Na+:H+ antiporter